jgi:CubicO group peptidase (beta-lactamase class C family)
MVAWITRLQATRQFAPGSAWAYSNSNYVLLAKVIEQASGASLRISSSQRLFAPAGLKDTAFDDPRDVVPHRVQGYRRARGRRRRALPMPIGSAPAYRARPEAFAPPSTTCCAGATRSTAPASSIGRGCSS